MPQVKTPLWRNSEDREIEREAKRVAVLRTAARIFNEKGYHATSLDEIAAQLGVTKPTLYYYIKGKEEILFECVRMGLQMVHDKVGESRSRGGTPLEQLLACIKVYTQIVTMDFGMCLIRVGEDPLPPSEQKRLRKLKRSIDSEFRQLIELAISDGSIAACDPKLLAFTIEGAASWVGRWYSPDGEFTPDQIADQMTSILFRGMVSDIHRDRPTPYAPYSAELPRSP